MFDVVAARLPSPAYDEIALRSGSALPRDGEWETPAQTSSRRSFKLGEIMPSVGGDYGQTIWQWSGESNA